MGRGAQLAELIELEATKLIQRHQRYAAQLHDELRRRDRRSGVRTPKVVKTPAYWGVDKGFNPYHVREAASAIAHSIETALLKGVYSPRPAIEYLVPKENGENRSVSIFQVADNALSRKVYHSLSAKNAPRLSARCYVYRKDITIHDAVAYIYSQFRRGERIYIAEFDFRKFFDRLTHEHFFQVMNEDGFLMTAREKQVLQAFLRAPLVAFNVKIPRERGMPQGTSVSLFLANAAGSILDRKLERLGVGFARYADDTLIWSNEYGEVCKDYSRTGYAVDALVETSKVMGVEVNFDKSSGISILSDMGEQPEFRHKVHVDFLGYAISRASLSIKRRKVEEIKDRISFILYSNLVQSPASGKIVP